MCLFPIVAEASSPLRVCFQPWRRPAVRCVFVSSRGGGQRSVAKFVSSGFEVWVICTVIKHGASHSAPGRMTFNPDILGGDTRIPVLWQIIYYVLLHALYALLGSCTRQWRNE